MISTKIFICSDMLGEELRTRTKTIVIPGMPPFCSPSEVGWIAPGSPSNSQNWTFVIDRKTGLDLSFGSACARIRPET
jgi:hypothetical protein